MKIQVHLNQSNRFILPVLLAGLVLISAGSCRGNDGEPVLNLLTNNRMIVILKGTYASDAPLDFSEINGNQLFIDGDDGAVDTGGLPAYSNLPIYIDIGEIRLSSKSMGQDLNIIQNSEDSRRFWDVLTTERQVYCSQAYTIDFDNNSCVKTGGMINFVEFMNGRGALYPSRDVGPGTYFHAGVFVRSLVTGYAKTDGTASEARFDNNDLLNAADVAVLASYDPDTDDLVSQLNPPQFFPLHHKELAGQQTMNVEDAYAPLVLELRFNIKENLMVHAFTNDNAQRRTVVAFSDWRQAHAGQTKMGGNVLLKARMFYPDFVSEVHISGGTTSTRHYYALYINSTCDPAASPFPCDYNDTLPLAATPVRNGTNILRNITSGRYLLQCRYDAVHDGYPEAILGETTFDIIGIKPPDVVDVGCACGHSTSSGCD